MAKKSKALEWIEFIPAVTLLFIIRLLPYTWALALGRTVARIAYPFLGSAKRDALEGLRNAFPQWDAKKITRTAKKSVEHMVMGFCELALMPKLSNDRLINKMVTYIGKEAVEDAFKQGKGIIVLAAHLGGWEFISAASGVLGYKPNVLVRPLDNTLLDRIVERYREAKGAKIIPRTGRSLRLIFEALTRNEPVAFLIDQNWAVGGIFVPFFGRPASTVKGPMQIALKTGAPVLCAYDIRHADMTHTVTLFPMEFEKKGTDEETIYYNTAKFTKIYEDIIREHPEQWLWAHPRWRTQPKENA